MGEKIWKPNPLKGCIHKWLWLWLGPICDAVNYPPVRGGDAQNLVVAMDIDKRFRYPNLSSTAQLLMLICMSLCKRS